MSISVMAEVWANPPMGGSPLLILLALADNADSERRLAWPSVASLAHKTHMSARSVQRALRDLVDDGHLTVARPGGRFNNEYRATVYRVEPVAARQNVTPARGDKSGDSGVSPVSPQPSGEPSTTERRSAPTRVTVDPHPHEGFGVKINGKLVDSYAWDKTTQALEHFNMIANKQLKPLNGAGGPSENAKRIFMRLKDWPDLTVEDVCDTINRTLASRWWGSDPPSIGVVFGPKVFEDNLTREPAPERDARNERDRKRQERTTRRREAIQRLVNQAKENQT